MSSIDAPSSPWATVFGIMRSHEDGVALMTLWEHQDEELLANGRSVTDVLDVVLPSERAVAERIASRMNEIDGDDWRYNNFYSATRGGPAPTRDELRSFVDRCRAGGVRLHYADGVDAPR